MLVIKEYLNGKLPLLRFDPVASAALGTKTISKYNEILRECIQSCDVIDKEESERRINRTKFMIYNSVYNKLKSTDVSSSIKNKYLKESLKYQHKLTRKNNNEKRIATPYS